MQVKSKRFGRLTKTVVAGAITACMVASLGLVGCGGGSNGGDQAADQVSGSVTAVGSTALQPLAEAAAEQFQGENPDVQITVQGGGSGQGITQIAEGSVQIGNSDVFAEEKLDDPSQAANLKDNQVCVVGMGPLVFSYFTDDIKALNVDGVEPTAQNVATNDWKIWSYEHMYTAASPDAATQAFIDYIMSEDVQSTLVAEQGYISIHDMKVSKDAEGNVTQL